jgi:hypothetical protein
LDVALAVRPMIRRLATAATSAYPVGGFDQMPLLLASAVLPTT